MLLKIKKIQYMKQQMLFTILLVTLESAGINFDDIITELKREGTSGFEEKKIGEYDL